MIFLSFIAIIAVGVGFIMYLAFGLHKENTDFINTLQFYLREKTVQANKAKAQLAVMQSRYDNLAKEYADLQSESVSVIENFEFSGMLGEKEFVEAKNQQIQRLENKIKTIRELTISDLI